ncbi:50S ribosomal protein L21 [Mycoplasmopsis canis UFG4]|uniref:Large ribosomal subunit protein bL21 n=2 Tax=Mycoplasmopsis canis TaxID=29555 RepID=I1A7D8_9BACT|nr:50S ribosomal protein L21 [Mycoplasmopsis canis]AKF40889.1 50S ribosomal protein L21 [Mycoplasmopsis canis]AMD81003.1 50S ribosomal protein L21 [Mycoplasmopsis canis PG 14]EIE40978.1 50S ribosomal protein L21 [Mycoplasmopsis canis PG 14]EIE41055.1 50S ribosomal protein L21 [Mycoplasmopsis canis UF31]EIE41179.1 50S ribosomal protein L21 [Mycoplasmopsis canis UF33]
MLAIIETGGKQLLVKEGQTIYIEKVEGQEGSEVKFDKVLLVVSEKSSKVGSPLVKNAVVSGVIEKQGRAKKIVVYRHNAKSTHKRKLGHRQPYTRVKITSIQG